MYKHAFESVFDVLRTFFTHAADSYLYYVHQGDLSRLQVYFSSPELKAQVSYSDRPLSVVRLFVRLSVNVYIFDFFSRTTGSILIKLGTNHLWG
jgi:hypothetical protein